MKKKKILKKEQSREFGSVSKVYVYKLLPVVLTSDKYKALIDYLEGI